MAPSSNAMRGISIILAAGAALGAAAPALANSNAADVDFRERTEIPAYLQCVPYARQVSGIQIYGDAHTWWKQAEGRFARGRTPQVGAVMAFRPHRNMQLGHVAAVSRVIDSRTVLLRHANWSPINGRRGQIENDVQAIDVSPANDWSEVRVWYAPLQALGKTPWPVEGFIYPAKAAAPRYSPQIARIDDGPARLKDSKAFTEAFGKGFDAAPTKPKKQRKPRKNTEFAEAAGLPAIY